MQRAIQSVLRGALRGLVKPMLGPPVPIAVQRAWIAAVTRTMLSARGVSRRHADCGGVPAEWLAPEGADPFAILYLHGGAFVLGSARTHRSITTHLARAAHATVVAPDYRLAPEHPYPAALDDAVNAYRALIERFGTGRVAIAGDSAGAGLALATAIALRERELAPPTALALIAPWVDLGASGDSMKTHARRDPMLRIGWTGQAGALYRGALASDDPRVSPLFANLRDLPRMLIQVGSEEILYSDAERLTDGARAAGIDVEFQPYQDQWHVFHLHAGLLHEADRAIAEIARFLRARRADTDEVSESLAA